MIGISLLLISYSLLIIHANRDRRDGQYLSGNRSGFLLPGVGAGTFEVGQATRICVVGICLEKVPGFDFSDEEVSVSTPVDGIFVESAAYFSGGEVDRRGGRFSRLGLSSAAGEKSQSGDDNP